MYLMLKQDKLDTFLLLEFLLLETFNSFIHLSDGNDVIIIFVPIVQKPCSNNVLKLHFDADACSNPIEIRREIHNISNEH